ncbi:MAG: TIGR04197 family type VII secretion effector [Lachnospiraceae bacterium]|nr:TIGR04197 family type VII secretion effector [Lachnospiraceae bacterium]
MSDINVDKSTVSTYSEGVSATAKGFSFDQLQYTDYKTTISAATKGRKAYYDAQWADLELGKCLEQEAKNIQSLGLKFAQYDEMLANIAEIETVRLSELPE